MRSTKAIFLKQMRDTMKNKMILIQFLMLPILSFIMTEMVAKADEEIPNTMFVTMFAAMFVGMTPLVTAASAIAEDREKKSLRFLVMAGVKPHEYLLGIGGFVFLLSSAASLFFALTGGFGTQDFLKFLSILLLGSLTSTLLGAAIGIFSKNQQQAMAISVPMFMVFAFCPMISQFNETVRLVANVFYTQQINTIVGDFSSPVLTPLLIILANIVVFAGLFALAYKKKGLKG